jgi:hypothetical protein
MQQSVLLTPYDWDEPTSAPALATRLYSELSTLREGGSSADDPLGVPLDVIILASDVTYDEAVVAPLVRSLTELQAVLVQQQPQVQVTVLLMHERRGEGIEQRLLAEIKATGWTAKQQDTKGLGVPRCEQALLLEVRL